MYLFVYLISPNRAHKTLYNIKLNDGRKTITYTLLAGKPALNKTATDKHKADVGRPNLRGQRKL